LEDTGKHAERSGPDLDRMVLEAVSQDYIPFESIVSNLTDREASFRDYVGTSLLALIASHLIAAYLLHAEPPFYTAVTATEDTLERYWYFITEKGEQYLQNIKGREGASSQ
jgi:hypothetical protein